MIVIRESAKKINSDMLRAGLTDLANSRTVAFKYYYCPNHKGGVNEFFVRGDFIVAKVTPAYFIIANPRDNSVFCEISLVNIKEILVDREFWTLPR